MTEAVICAFIAYVIPIIIINTFLIALRYRKVPEICVDDFMDIEIPDVIVMVLVSFLPIINILVMISYACDVYDRKRNRGEPKPWIKPAKKTIDIDS